MFIRVDDSEDMEIEGYSYLNKDEIEETVTVDSQCVDINTYPNLTATVFHEDIPKLIKALQMAHDHIQKGAK